MLEDGEELLEDADAARGVLAASGLARDELVDPWGREYVIEVRPERRAFLYSTRGRDGRLGGVGADEDHGCLVGSDGATLVHDAWPALTLAALLPSVPPPAIEDDPYQDVIEPKGSIDRVTISPGGELWMGTSWGELLRSRDRGASWQRVETGARSSKSISALGRVGSDRLSFVTFFGPRTAIVAGAIGELHDRVLRTTDGGETWESLTLPGGVWASDVCTLGDGSPLGWLAGSRRTLLVTKDAGATWRALETPFEEMPALVGVSFVSENLGVVAGRDGELAQTRDGGVTWSLLEGPVLESGEESQGGACSSCRRQAGRACGLWATVSCSMQRARSMSPS